MAIRPLGQLGLHRGVWPLLRSFLVLAGALLSSACVHFPSYPRLVTEAESTRILIREVRLFPATSREVLEHQDVLVEDGLIREVSATSPGRTVDGLLIDGRGKTLLPGLSCQRCEQG